MWALRSPDPSLVGARALVSGGVDRRRALLERDRLSRAAVAAERSEHGARIDEVTRRGKAGTAPRDADQIVAGRGNRRVAVGVRKGGVQGDQRSVDITEGGVLTECDAAAHVAPGVVRVAIVEGDRREGEVDVTDISGVSIGVRSEDPTAARSGIVAGDRRVDDTNQAGAVRPDAAPRSGRVVAGKGRAADRHLGTLEPNPAARSSREQRR